MAKPDEPTLKEMLQRTEGWIRWAADAVEGVSFSREGLAGFRTGDPIMDPQPLTKHPDRPDRCHHPKKGAAVFVSPAELAGTLRKTGDTVQEVIKLIK